MINAIGREIPEYVDGYGQGVPFAGAFATRPRTRRHAPPVKMVRPGESKLVVDLREVFERIPIEDGMTLSFHHHLRNRDGVVNMVLDIAAELGVKDLKVALSSVFPVHEPMVGHFESGVVAALDTDYLSGPVAEAVAGMHRHLCGAWLLQVEDAPGADRASPFPHRSGIGHRPPPFRPPTSAPNSPAKGNRAGEHVPVPARPIGAGCPWRGGSGGSSTKLRRRIFPPSGEARGGAASYNQRGRRRHFSWIRR